MAKLEGWELELQCVVPPTLHQCSGCSHAQGVLRQMGRDKAFRVPPKCCAGNTTLIGKETWGFGARKGRQRPGFIQIHSGSQTATADHRLFLKNIWL